ncbi:MAG: sulfatase-like hydrolase/transferase [Acidobacteriota bacterium]
MAGSCRKYVAAGVVTAALVSLAGPVAGQEPERPNILWITAEDLSPHLGCYGDSYARTPRLDAFAREALLFTRAFATAPVCSPARSCLITGVYATSLGTQRLRSAFPIPDEIHGFPYYLRRAGYYTSNDVKTDYNTSDEPRLIRESWDDCRSGADWRGRKPGQPFFSVINLMTTHQSRTSVWSFEQFEREIGGRLRPEERHDPTRAPLPPYYPDTELARRTWARYHDCITLLDRQVGEILDRLQADGLADDTIVFFFGDHGMGMPRGKRVLHDAGLQVPLLIRFPEKWRHLAPADPGTRVDRLVSFVDFPPSVLALAGIPAPDHMQGVPFLGAQPGPPRQYVFGARDRVDEAYDVARSVRDERFLYIRNYMPHLSWMQLERYSDQSDFRRELLHLAAAGKLPPPAMTYAAPRRAREELYDTAADPHQLRNLAADPDYAGVLERMRGRLREWLRETRDVGFLPESEVLAVTHGLPPYTWARAQERYPTEELLAVVEAVGEPFSLEDVQRGLRSPDPAVRYWTLIAAEAAPELEAPVLNCLMKAINDVAPAVRIAAARLLLRQGRTSPALAVLERELQSDRADVALEAARAVEELREWTRPLQSTAEAVLEAARRRQAEHPCWLFVIFALEETLERWEGTAGTG